MPRAAMAGSTSAPTTCRSVSTVHGVTASNRPPRIVSTSCSVVRAKSFNEDSHTSVSFTHRATSSPFGLLGGRGLYLLGTRCRCLSQRATFLEQRVTFLEQRATFLGT